MSKYQDVRELTLKLTREQCEQMLVGIGISCSDQESLYTLQVAVAHAVIDGDLSIRDIC